MRTCFLCCLLCLAASALGQSPGGRDSDHDGLSDGFENALLQRFAPRFMISSEDCSARPARFLSGVTDPTVAQDDGSIYGQATLHVPPRNEAQQIELHFYHLWRTDCGRLGHPLDAEHVAVLLQILPREKLDAWDPMAWSALYWYAAAHEDTVCDASQITRASTLNATSHGPVVWISSGKHASFLNEELCRHGCGGDRCVQSTMLTSSPVINLGERNAPMNGAAWLASSRWPLKEKLSRSDFRADRLTRLERLPSPDIAWADPAKRPAQAAILGGNDAVDGVLTGSHATGGALAMSAQSTDTALSVAGASTADSLKTAIHKTGGALRKSIHAVQHPVAVRQQAGP